MERPPRVSVILPTYNRARLLPRAMRSVLNQSWRDLELIVVDDGSSDDTAAVVAAFDDSRVRYLAPAGNLGDAGARNRGIAAARGEWLAFQDSDDEWLLHKLALQMQYALGPQAEWAAVAASVLRLAGRQIEYIAWPRTGGNADVGEVEFAAFLYGMTAYLQGLVVRRDAVEALGGFDTRLRARSDFDFCLRLAQRYRVAAIIEPVAVSHESPTSISGRIEYQLADCHYLLTRHAAILQSQPVAQARYHYLYARTLVFAGRRRQALRALRQALGCRPGYRQAWLLMLLVGFCGAAGAARLLLWRVQRRQALVL
jgi:glycosyltransferase involved in cell wall biosynthesis